MVIATYFKRLPYFVFVDFLSRALSDTNKVSGVSIGQHHHIDYSHSRVVDWRNSDWVKWFAGCLFTIFVCNHTVIWSLVKAIYTGRSGRLPMPTSV